MSSGEGRKSAFKIHAESQGELVAHNHNESSLLKAKSLAQLSMDTTQMDDHYIQHFTVMALPEVRILSRLYCLQKSFGWDYNSISIINWGSPCVYTDSNTCKHIKLKILQSMSEFIGLWQHQNNPRFTEKSVRVFKMLRVNNKLVCEPVPKGAGRGPSSFWS